MKVSGKVLLVEDEQSIRALLARVMMEMGLTVVAVGKVADALSTLQEEPFKLLVTDLQLPDGSGVNVVRCFAEKYSPQKVLIVTGQAATSPEMTDLSSGPACEILYKPVELAEFRATVLRLLR